MSDQTQDDPTTGPMDDQDGSEAQSRVDTQEETPIGADASTGSGDTGGGDVIGAETPGQSSDTVKDPSNWVTGDEPMTGAQRSYLDTLARRAGEQLPAELTKAEASEHIDRLQSGTGGTGGTGGSGGAGGSGSGGSSS